MPLKRLKDSLTKTREGVIGRIAQIVSRGKLDDQMLEDIEGILIEGDVGVNTTLEVIQNLRERIKRERIEGFEDVKGLLKEELQRLLVVDSKFNQEDFFNPPIKPFVIMIVGVNGTGKTTTIGKLAYKFKRNGKRVLVAVADTFRAAAAEQMEIWAKRAGADLVRQQPGADPAAVAFDALKAAKARGMDALIIDTAGRLHTKINLMEELKKIKRVLTKQMESAPHEVLLVLDATTGQNALRQTREFNQAVGVTGLVLAKLDGTAKGGILIPISRELNIPVKFIGTGEGIEDLEPFDPESFLKALFEG